AMVERSYQLAAEVQEKVVALAPKATRPRMQLALLYHLLGTWQAETGRNAGPAFAAAAGHWKTLTELRPDAAQYLQHWAVTLKDWAAHVNQRRDRAGVRALLREALGHLDRALKLQP